ncbi:MAG: hypothetical protein WD749_02555 [Phycisphaerales bacterium]
MSNLACPSCSAAIPADDVNIGEGVALCRACSTLSRLSALAATAPLAVQGTLAGVNPAAPPAGCSMSGNGVETVLVASCRSIPTAAVALGMAAFWNGIVSVFVLIAIASTLHHALGSVPAWFPAPPMGSGQGGAPMPLGMTLFLWVFLAPFIAIGAMLAGVVATLLVGRVEVRVRSDSASAFTGVGPLGWRRRFDPLHVRQVSIGQTTWKQNDQTRPVIVIEGESAIRIGSLLTETRRNWLGAALQEILVPRGGVRC